jgi:hypothetical protein
MKRRQVLLLVVLALTTAFVSCSKDTSYSNPVSPEEKAHDAFKQAFISEFGEPDSNQDWGFETSTTRNTERRAAQSNEQLLALGEDIVNLSIEDLMASGFKRIIAEDLTVSQNSDFDYNDIVFDAKLVQEADDEGYSTFYLIVRATGAHKKIFVGSTEPEAEGEGFEVHELFGVTQKDFINTVSKPKEGENAADWRKDHNPVFYALKVKNTSNTAPSLIDIPIYAEDNPLALTAKKGQPAEKLCVDVDYSWVVEKEKMRNWYPTFMHYVVGEEPEQSWWHTTYWSDEEAQPDEWGTAVYMNVGSKRYVITFEQQGMKDGVLKFATEKPITIRAFEIDNNNTRTQIDLDGQTNKISVLCSGNHSHFANSINYSNTSMDATLITPNAEKTIIHAPVEITLTVGGSKGSVKSTINIWPTSYLSSHI